MMFPKITKKVEIEQQLNKVKTEIEEALFEFSCYPRDEEAFFTECFDVVHAAETLLYVLMEDLSLPEFNDYRDAVIEKNKSRGYYD